MPGLGKTTLATKLYNHAQVGCHFDVRAWCVASQAYKKGNMLIEILMSIGHLKRETIIVMQDADLAQKRYQSLKGRRFLVVVDDIRDIDAWNELERYFPNDNVGSRILFTTRNKEVDYCPEELLDIGNQIARNCHGLPLQVVAIAGVLANMEKKKCSWKKVARNLTSHISENSELSYKHLPMHLKPCFLYFGAFDEDKEIKVGLLNYTWGPYVCEGGVNRSVHPLAINIFILREMCLRISYEKHFLKVAPIYKCPDGAPFFIQHKCLIMDNLSSPTNLIPFGLHVRSLSVYFGWKAFNSCGFRFLRVLGIQKCWASVIGIERLVHLRHLKIPTVLDQIESFHKLEFLDMRHVFFVEPEILLNMVSLKQIYCKLSRFSESCRQQATKDKNFQTNSNLQSISSLSICDETDEKILRSLRNLRRVKVLCRSSLNYSFDFFYQLESLKLIKEEDISFEGRHWDTSKVEFPQLKFMKLWNVNLVKLNASHRTFPILRQLVLQNCKHLKIIPSSFSKILTLEIIEVYGCVKAVKESAKKILEKQQDTGNEGLKIIISEQIAPDETYGVIHLGTQYFLLKNNGNGEENYKNISMKILILHTELH
ncbi:putative late blight resistance protein homolog R1A-10 [Olea europaea var. sylvestris]|uniref:putative late blight resistance protein homolog R1A-10 n=1 Tax=Olea europaea var. sylvestris TaxID=158386 RepID=UPI000C1D62E5|nr:putative late blight resistance protein homolog R1A-10 [Olea europaea var. sylvestris]